MRLSKLVLSNATIIPSQEMCTRKNIVFLLLSVDATFFTKHGGAC